MDIKQQIKLKSMYRNFLKNWNAITFLRKKCRLYIKFEVIYKPVPYAIANILISILVYYIIIIINTKTLETKAKLKKKLSNNYAKNKYATTMQQKMEYLKINMMEQ